MIAALKTQRFTLGLKLREMGIPQYVIDNYQEDKLALLVEKVQENPWRFYDRENGFSLNLCEKLAEKFHVNNELEKAKCFLQFAIDKTADQGHCYAREWQVNNNIKHGNFSDYVKQQAIDFLQKDGTLFVSQKGNYFLSKYFNAEKKFAELLKSLDRQNGYFTGFRKDYSFLYDDLNEAQREAVDAVEYNRLIILTGLPGTGKTTTIRAIVDSYGYDNVVLLAPTGKAASRISELCRIQASTLHSFFFNPQGFVNTIQGKIVIIDETSMLDAEIAGWASEGIKDDCVLIIVGDPDQLPSVGPGQILQDILDSEVGCRYHLKEIMRQKPGSIIRSAHSIHAGNNLVYGKDNEVISYFPKRWDLEGITSKICQHPEWRDAQFLSVLKEKGSQIVNKVAQQTLNPKTTDGFRLGDKVIHTKNNKDLGVYNGEMGIVINNTDRKLTVEFRDKIIDYTGSWLWQLELAYCITTHKSQGSEFDKVVFFVNESQITSRNIIYTALTRAKNKILVIAPSDQVLQNAISNKQKPRQTSLGFLLKRES